MTLTLAGGSVSDVHITQHPSNPNTRKFQGEFAGGIQSQIVGRKLDEMNVSKVAGSSLTSGGFNQAGGKDQVRGRGPGAVTARHYRQSQKGGHVPHPGWIDYSFDGIGTRWEISTPSPLADGHRRRLLEVVADYDAAWSRFRSDSRDCGGRAAAGPLHPAARCSRAGPALRNPLPADRGP